MLWYFAWLSNAHHLSEKRQGMNTLLSSKVRFWTTKKKKTEKDSHQRCLKKNKKTDAQLQRQMEVPSEKRRGVRQTPWWEWGMNNKWWEISIVDWGIWLQMLRWAACGRAQFNPRINWLTLLGWWFTTRTLSSWIPAQVQGDSALAQRWFARFCDAKEPPLKKKKNATLLETLLLAAEHKRVWDSCNDGLRLFGNLMCRQWEEISQQHKEVRFLSFLGQEQLLGKQQRFVCHLMEQMYLNCNQ